MITVEKITADTFRVTVDTQTTTQHTVWLSPAYHSQLTGGTVEPASLLEESFRFLLEREPNTSILREFDLPLIGRYFPEYEKEIGERVRRR